MPGDQMRRRTTSPYWPLERITSSYLLIIMTQMIWLLSPIFLQVGQLEFSGLKGVKISVEKVDALQEVRGVIHQREENVADDDLQDGQLSAAVQILAQLWGRGKSWWREHWDGGVPQDQSGPSHSTRRLHPLGLIRSGGGRDLPHLPHSLLLHWIPAEMESWDLCFISNISLSSKSEFLA